jgi:hypothetical protein
MTYTAIASLAATRRLPWNSPARLEFSWHGGRPEYALGKHSSGRASNNEELAIGWHSLANKPPDGRTKASPGRVLG